MDRVAITEDNKSPLLEIVLWFCLILSILTVLIRVVIKLSLLRRFNFDDVLIIGSLVSASAQSILVSIAASNGLGQRFSSLSTTQISAQLKAEYAACFLFIASACFAKLSLVAFLRHLSHFIFDQRAGLVIGVGIIIWSITSIFTTAFQCELPSPWDFAHGSCFNRVAWMNYVSIGNIITDAALISLPVVTIVRLKVEKRKKIILILVFMGRLCVIAAVTAQLVYLNQIRPLGDPSFDLWPIVVCAQVAQCLSIVTACTIYLKPFIDSLESGFINLGDLRRQNVLQIEYGQARGHDNSRGTKSPFSLRSLKTKISKPSNASEHIELDSRDPGPIEAGQNPENQDWDATSRSRILRTTTVAVERAPREHGIIEYPGHLGPDNSRNDS